MMKSIIKILFCLITLLLFSCNSKIFLYEELLNQAHKQSNEVEYKTKKVNNLSIHFPVSKNKDISNYLEKLIEKDVRDLCCVCEEGNIDVIYELTFSTDSLFSIKKETKTMFCYPYDNMSKDFFNLLICENRMYLVDLQKTKEVEKSIKKYIDNYEDLDTDCNYKDYDLNLSFEENKVYAYLIKDKVCFLKIPIKIKQDNLIFVNVPNES